MFVVIYTGQDGTRKVRTMTEDHCSEEMTEFASGYITYVKQAFTFEKSSGQDKYSILQVFEPYNNDAWYTAILSSPVHDLFHLRPGLTKQKLYFCIDRAVDQQLAECLNEEDLILEF